MFFDHGWRWRFEVIWWNSTYFLCPAWVSVSLAYTSCFADYTSLAFFSALGSTAWDLQLYIKRRAIFSPVLLQAPVWVSAVSCQSSQIMPQFPAYLSNCIILNCYNRLQHFRARRTLDIFKGHLKRHCNINNKILLCML